MALKRLAIAGDIDEAQLRGTQRSLMRGSFVFLSIMIVVLLLLPCAGASGALQEVENIRMALSKDAYWYPPEGTARLDVTLNNQSGETLEDVSLRARVHTSNRTREDLDSSIEGEPRRSYRFTETLGEDVTLTTGNSSFEFHLPLSERRLSDGVYPLTIEALYSGDVIAKAVSELIVMSTQDPAYSPLKLAIVFDVLEPTHRLPDGRFKDNGLAAECATGSENPGFYTSIVDELERWQNLFVTFSLSPLLLEEMQDMADGYVLQVGDSEEEFGSDSSNAGNVSRVLESFEKMAQQQRFQFLSTPYAAPDLERLWDLEWQYDALDQISLGHEVLEENLRTTITQDYFYPPGMNLSSRVIGGLGTQIGNFLLLGPQLLQRSRAGRNLASGLTLSSPVEIEGGEDRQVIALFADARLLDLIDRVGSSRDAHGVAQIILSDITNLYLERPARERVCAMQWPGTWRPGSKVIEEVIEALATAPWLQSITMSESFFAVSPVSDTVLEIPDPEADPGQAEYFGLVGDGRTSYQNFSKMIFIDNPLTDLLRHDLFVAESDVWRQWSQEQVGLGFASFITDTFQAELAKIKISSTSAVTLTSQKGDVPLTVTNDTGYKVNATLNLSSNGLSFPEGAIQEVTLEQKENIFEIPVEATAGGSLRLSVRLESNGTVLDITDIIVRTGRLSRFAVILVGAILGVILLAWALRILARRKAGKHKKGQIRKVDEEGA